MKTQFRVGELNDCGILLIYSMKDEIQINPDYQRMGEIWTLEKRQLLIDSIINGYDIPKIYFHEFEKQKVIDGTAKSFAIVDGKQRLTAIWEFIENKFALAADFVYLPDPTVKAANMTYKDIANTFNNLKIRFDQKRLPIFTIQTEDIELIEDMFSRLNEAVPLNAAEKRNAWPGVLPKTIRSVAKHKFFSECLPFKNVRYRHFDIVTKFLLIEHEGKITDTKKAYLDELVETYATKAETDASALEAKCIPILDAMATLFTKDDWLLRSVGMVTLFYVLFRNAISQKWVNKITRPMFTHFEDARLANRAKAEEKISKASYKLLEFDRLSQSPNDQVAIEFRVGVLETFVKNKAGV